MEECGDYLKKSIETLEEFVDLSNRCSPALSKDFLDQANKTKSSITAFLNDRLMKFRYLTKFHLQWCAVLSQLGHHHQALKQSRIASDHAMDSILYTEKIADRKLRKSSYQTRLRQQSSSKTSLTRHLNDHNFHYSMEGS